MTYTIHDQIADEIDDLMSSEERRIARVEAFGVRVQWEVARDKAAAPEYSGEAA
jgi:hypothetical protein